MGDGNPLSETKRGWMNFPPGRGQGWGIQVTSSTGTLVYQEEVSLNEFGSFAVDFALSDITPTGEYRIIASKGKKTYSGRFLVEEYTLEKIKLTIETDREVYFRGETIHGTIKAEYYYGEPLKEKPVRYALAHLDTFSAITDERGNVPFSLSTRDFAESQTLTLTARLDDENVQTGKTVWLATRGFECTVDTIRKVYLAGEDIEVKVETKDPAGNPLEQALTLSVFKHEQGEVTIEEQEIITDSDGKGKAMIRLEEGGNYTVRAEGIDRFGNPVSGQTDVCISGEDDEVKLRIVTDAEEFKVGDEPDISLHSRAAQGLGLLTYEAEAILSYRIIPINPDVNPLTLTIESELAPNFTLAVAQMDGSAFHQAQKEFSVVQQLNIGIAVKETEFFTPGETVVVTMTTTDQNGKPVSAEISLAMVDESLYAQYAELIPPMKDVFYNQRRGLLSKTDSSCTFRFDAVTKEIVSEILDEAKRVENEEMLAMEPSLAPSKSQAFGFSDESSALGRIAPTRRDDMVFPAEAPAPMSQVVSDEDSGAFLTALREYFPETGYWNPSIVTDKNGKATLEISLPDSTTEWRFTSRGITKKTLVGEATRSIVTKLPFFADMKVPAVFTEGDSATLLASLHNYSGAAQDVQLSFSGSMESDTFTQQTQQFTAEDGHVEEVEYPLDFSDVPELQKLTPISLELTATAGEFGDRITRDVPVRPWGIEYATTKSGTVQDDRQVEISLPGDRQYFSREMRILLNPALDRTLLDLADDTPWPFKAPQSSVIHEAVVVLNALKFEQQIADSDTQAEKIALHNRLKSLLTEITLAQNMDNGWNWTGEGQRSNLFVSADAMLLLTEAQKMGYDINPGVLQKGISYLKRAFQSAQDNEIKAYLLYALAVAGDVDFAHVNRIYRERNSLRTNGLALLALTYSRLNRPEIAAELLGMLNARAKVQRDDVTGKQRVFWSSDSPYSWLQQDVDTTALALLALQRSEPASPRIAEVVAWLSTQRQWLGWGSMKSNARVSSALYDYFSNTKHATDRYVVKIAVNGQEIQTVNVEGGQDVVTLEIPAKILKNDGNTVNFDFEGRGAVNYVCLLKGVSRAVRKTQEHFEIQRFYEPAPLSYKGREIQRGFSVLSGSYSTWRNAVTELPLGGFAQVTLHYHRREYDRQEPYKNSSLILEEPIPAGCSVLKDSIQGGVLDYEIRDGKIVFYLNNARYGTVSYHLYGYLPGSYRVLPTRIQSAYAALQRDYGKPYNLTVLARGEEVSETYKKTPDELYDYGKALFEDKRWAEARKLLKQLFETSHIKAEPYKETARMLLHIAIAENHSRDIVHYFEVLKEKYPDLVLSFQDIVCVGQAYRDIEEFERAVQVFKAIARASFLKDVQVSGTLEAQGEFLPSVEYTMDLLMRYPDIPTTETSFYALAQLLYTEAARSEGRSETESRASGTPRRSELDYKQLLNRTIAMLHQFLTLYPENPIVDEVSFSLANAFLDLEDFESAITQAQAFQRRYPKSPFLSGYQYIEGYSHFELERYDEALKICQTVATEKYPDKQGRLVDSDHKDLAIYIMGQIYHSMGQPEQAIEEYEKVKDLFPDAQESLTSFTRKLLKLDEVTTFTPEEEKPDYEIPLHYRNVKDASILVYRVDLMKLYLLQKNLNSITDINLAGITPYLQKAVELGDGKDYADKKFSLPLLLKQEGAYLVVAKETELDTSGMALVSPLKMDVDEDAVSGRVRVNVKNAVTGKYENNAHVKVIGSQDAEFVSGSTDLRGIFIADNIHGTATVIARKGDQYAFYRGETALQQQAFQQDQFRPLKTPQDMRSQATQQLRASNQMIQQQSESYLRKNLYQNKQVGVEVQSAY